MSNDSVTEKVSVNMNTSTLSSIDLLVDNGYYSNRSDFINQSVRETLRQHRADIDRIIKANDESEDSGRIWFIGIYALEQRDLLRFKAMQEQGDKDMKLKGLVVEAHENKSKVDIKGYGVLIISEDCTEELLFETVSSISIRGRINCSDSIKKHYGLK